MSSRKCNKKKINRDRNREYSCKVEGCGKKFRSVGYVKYHQAAHNGQKVLECEFEGCDRKFAWPTHLKYHLMTHTGSRLYKCQVCGKAFYTAQRLKVHRRSHTGEKPFQCTEEGCYKGFTTAGNLKNHMRIHTGDKPFECTFKGCEKRFAERSSLRKHNLVHSGLKPFKCKICNKLFSQTGSRNVHMKRRHSENLLVDKDELSLLGNMKHVITIANMAQEKVRSVTSTNENLGFGSKSKRSNSVVKPNANVVVLMQPEDLSALQFVKQEVVLEASPSP